MHEAQEVRRMLNKQRLGTFVLGGLAGVLAGILFAPKSGKELRGSITSRADEARERGRETYFEAQEILQERIAEARDRSPHFQEAHTGEESTMDGFPKLKPVASEPMPDVESPVEMPPDPTPLRDLSWDSPQPGSGQDSDPAEIRRRIQETRLRLRARLDAQEAGDATEERDG
jgi:gas vesicle protein